MKNKKQEEFINFIIEKIKENDNLKNFINRIEEIEEIIVKRTGVSEYDISIKGRYYVTNVLECTTRSAEDIIIYNTNTGLICWKTDKNKYEQ